jgi:hypothetical protein
MQAIVEKCLEVLKAKFMPLSRVLVFSWALCVVVGGSPLG